jgi:hypothetical protein
MESFLQAQYLVLAFLFVVAAATKLLRSDLSILARNAFLTRDASIKMGVFIWRLVGILELSLVGLLLVPSTREAGAAAVVGFSAIGTAYTIAAVLQSGESPSCGCLSADEPASWRSVLRACGCVAIGVGVLASASPAIVPSLNFQSGLLLACELAALWLLTPEAAPLRLVHQLRMRRIPGCLTSRHSLEWTVAQLRRSDLWLRMQPYLVENSIKDHWRDGCWRFLAFPAKDHGGDATVIIAVKLPPGALQIRGAVVPADETLPVREMVERFGRSRRLRRAFNKVAAPTLAVLACMLVATGMGATTLRLLILPGRSIGQASLGQTSTRLRAEFGPPQRVLRYRGALGSSVERYFYGRLTVDLRASATKMRVIRVLSNSSLARTASGVGAGVSELRVRKAFPAARCFRQGTQRYCQIGNPKRPGSRITTFILRGGTVRTVVVAFAINT